MPKSCYLCKKPLSPGEWTPEKEHEAWMELTARMSDRLGLDRTITTLEFFCEEMRKRMAANPRLR